MISKNQFQRISSLQHGKYRQKYNQFLVEGAKAVKELLKSDYKITELIIDQDYQEKLSEFYSHPSLIETDSNNFKKLSALENPQGILAVAEMKENSIELENFKNTWTIGLDRIQDPGNLGTIIRLADWYGIENIFCNRGTVDFYNPKVIQATMGSFLRVKIVYGDLLEFISTNTIVSYATAMSGESIYQSKHKAGMILIGNEGSGLDEKLIQISAKSLSIPRKGKSESLNAGVAAGIIIDRLLNP